MSRCEPLEGNADFYGLGIRIGVYLQWASTWLSLLLDPESSQAVLDANSVFFLAAAIATVIAATRDAPAIEIYIMLQILLGFPFTTLSTFGLRLWLTSPRRLDQLPDIFGQLKQDFMKLWAASGPSTEPQPGHIVLPKLVDFAVRVYRTSSRGGDNERDAMSMVLVSRLTFPGLSISGAVWRGLALFVVLGHNLAYWFAENGHGVHTTTTLSNNNNNNNSTGCRTPTVFLFSIQPLGDTVISIGRAAAIAATILVAYPTLVVIRFLQLICLALVELAFLPQSPASGSSNQGQSNQVQPEPANVPHAEVPPAERPEDDSRPLKIIHVALMVFMPKPFTAHRSEQRGNVSGTARTGTVLSGWRITHPR